MKKIALLLMFCFVFQILAADKDKKKKKSQPQTQPETQTEPTVSYEVIKEGTSSGIREPIAKAISTEAEWQDLWKKHVSILVPQPLLPEIDFSNQVVVAIFAGEKNTSGYRVVIKNVSFKGADIVVTYKLTEPPANSYILQVVTQPFVLLKVSKAPNGNLQLVKQ